MGTARNTQEETACETKVAPDWIILKRNIKKWGVSKDSNWIHCASLTVPVAMIMNLQTVKRRGI
jgi:hypothetical protein